MRAWDLGRNVSVYTVSHTLLMLVALSGSVGTSCAHSSTQPSKALTSARAVSPVISQLTPTISPVGAVVMITGSGFASRGNTLKFGIGYIRNLESTDGTTLRFTVPDGLELCAPDAQGPCPGAYPQVTPGDYVVAVITNGETSNNVSFTVTDQ